MATYSKLLLSGSAYGQPIAVNTTASSVATQLHTSIAGTAGFDEVYIYASNQAAASIVLTVCWGNTGSANQIISSISGQSGRTLICDGMLLNNGLTAYAFAASTGSILIDGFVNRIQ